MTQKELNQLKNEVSKTMEELRKKVNDDYLFIAITSIYFSEDKSLKKILSGFKDKKFCKDYESSLKKQNLTLM